MKFLINIFAKYLLACWTYDPIFDMPETYIDIENDVSHGDRLYNQFEKLLLLLRGYEDKQSTQEHIYTKTLQKDDKYQDAAREFHAQNYERALSLFKDLEQTSLCEVIRETSCYMIARCLLILAQTKWDGCSNPVESVDQDQLEQAKKHYLDYLKKHPNGAFANSSQNIIRKIAYLSGNKTELDKSLKKNVLKHFPNYPSSPFFNKEILIEFKNYFNGKINPKSDSPILLAYELLGQQQPQEEYLNFLEKRKEDFRGYGDLFIFLKSILLYKKGNYKELIDLTKNIRIQKDVLFLSIGVLRARALSKCREYKKALKILKEIHKLHKEDLIEVEIAKIYIENKDSLRIFSNNSCVEKEKILENIAQFALTTQELEFISSSNKLDSKKLVLVCEELIRRYALCSDFQKLDRVLAKNIPSKKFKISHTCIKSLVKNPKDWSALCDFGEFLYTHIQKFETKLDFNLEDPDSFNSDPKKDFISVFKTKPIHKNTREYVFPLTIFLAVVKNTDKEVRAKALHYIVYSTRTDTNYLYERTGYFDLKDKKIAKNAFRELHAQYPNSQWAQKTKYYYE